MRKSFDGLMAIIRDTYQLDPYANALYLFCGRDSRKLKALHSTRMALCSIRNDLMKMVVFNGRAMLRKPDY